MKKKILVLFFAFLCLGLVQSQSTDILKVEYNECVTFIPPRVNENKGVLYAFDNLTFYKTVYIKKEKKKTREVTDDTFIIENKGLEKQFSEIVINRKTKELIEHLFEQRAIHDYFSVYEKQPEMKWELLEDEKKINDYNCKKATTTFRGRSYEVWYTPDIPISVGPWKFSGLPGLILSVKDTTDGYYTWVVSSVTYPYKGGEMSVSEIMSDKNGFSKLSYQEFDTKFLNYMEERTKRVRSKYNRNSRIGFEYSTFQHKEPINEWRTQTEFKF